MSQRKPVVEWSSDFDHLAPQWTADPYPIWDELRKCPIAHTERYGGVSFLSRFEDVRKVAYDTEHFSARQVIVRERPPGEMSGAIPSGVLPDPPAHRGLKNSLLPAVSSAAIENYGPRIRAICREILGRLKGRARCDAAAEYAQEFPTRITACIFGISDQDGERFRKWVHELIEVSVTDPAVMIRARNEMAAFFRREIENRRLHRSHDLIANLVDARPDGEPLSTDVIIGLLRLMLVGGIHTTSNLMGSCLWHLAVHADDRERLVAEPGLIPIAVEEFLRAYAPVTSGREILKETQIADFAFQVGEMVLLSFPAANRDPSIFTDADRVILDRRPNRHMAFGAGIHRCLGADLARMEMTIALQEWLATFPEFTLDPEEPVTWRQGQVRGPHRLPLLLVP